MKLKQSVSRYFTNFSNPYKIHPPQKKNSPYTAWLQPKRNLSRAMRRILYKNLR